MNEIKRLQKLAGILTEIRVNNPTISDDDIQDLYNKIYQQIEEYFDDDNQNIMHNLDGKLDNIGQKYNIKDIIDGISIEEFEHLNPTEKISFYNDLIKFNQHLDSNPPLNEDVSDFNIGQSSETGGRRTTVTDIDPETQSVTWSVKKEVDNSTIYKDLSDLIKKFETVQLKDFHSRPKLIQLVKDLKSIRNKFSRTVVKEDYKVLKENLVGILNEIKVNNPNKPKVYLDNDQPYIILKDGTKVWGYRGDEDTFTIDLDDPGYSKEIIDYFDNYAELKDIGVTSYLLIHNKDVNI